jgi:nitrite reductase (NO-forming)/hydroxylamine reductase
MLNIKETGMVWLVNYTDPIHPKITEIPTARSLNDGGLDASGNYLIPELD